MKKYLILILLTGMAALFARGSSEASAADDISVESEAQIDLRKLVEENGDFLLLDVRTDSEYRDGHIPGAINIPYDEIEELFFEENKERLIVLYCRSGRRSGIASDTLRNMGYYNLFDYKRFSDWEGEVITGDSPR